MRLIRIMDDSMYTEAYLNKLKLMLSDGFRRLVIANINKPAERTPKTLNVPHCIPISQPAIPIDAAESMLDIAIIRRVKEKPNLAGTVGIPAS